MGRQRVWPRRPEADGWRPNSTSMKLCMYRSVHFARRPMYSKYTAFGVRVRVVYAVPGAVSDPRPDTPSSSDFLTSSHEKRCVGLAKLRFGLPYSLVAESERFGEGIIVGSVSTQTVPEAGSAFMARRSQRLSQGEQGCSPTEPVASPTDRTRPCVSPREGRSISGMPCRRAGHPSSSSALVVLQQQVLPQLVACGSPTRRL